MHKWLGQIQACLLSIYFHLTAQIELVKETSEIIKKFLLFFEQWQKINKDKGIREKLDAEQINTLEQLISWINIVNPFVKKMDELISFVLQNRSVLRGFQDVWNMIKKSIVDLKENFAQIQVLEKKISGGKIEYSIREFLSDITEFFEVPFEHYTENVLSSSFWSELETDIDFRKKFVSIWQSLSNTKPDEKKKVLSIKSFAISSFLMDKWSILMANVFDITEEDAQVFLKGLQGNQFDRLVDFLESQMQTMKKK